MIPEVMILHRIFCHGLELIPLLLNLYAVLKMLGRDTWLDGINELNKTLTAICNHPEESRGHVVHFAQSQVCAQERTVDVTDEECPPPQSAIEMTGSLEEGFMELLWLDL